MEYPKPRPSRFSLEVRRSRTGLGLYALEEIPAHRFVIEYHGRLVSDAAAQAVGGRYLFELENGKTILGGTRKNVARYANHSCVPNCEVRFSKNRVFVYSTKRIRAGQEITYDYGEEYFDAFITARRCRCPRCTKKRQRTRA